MTQIIGTVYDPQRVTATIAAAVRGAESFQPKGEYDADTTYFLNDVVSLKKNGALFQAININETGFKGKHPYAADWEDYWFKIAEYFPYTEAKTGDTLVAFDQTDGGIKDSNIETTDVSTAVSNTHVQNTDQYLDYGGEFEVTAEDLYVTFNKSHSQDSDSYLDFGATTQVSAAMIFNSLNYLYAAPEAFLPRTTNGAQYVKEESTTYDQMKGTWLFDPATSEGIQLEVRNYGSGSLTTEHFKCKLHYKVKMGNGVPEYTKVAFRIKGAIEKDTVDVAWGTAVQLNETIEAQNTVYHTAWSSLITASGTIAENCSMLIEINRYSNDAENDTYADDVALVGVEFQFNIPAPS